MIKEKTFAVIGGDMRQAYLANALAGKEAGYHIYGMYFGGEVKLSSRIHCSDDVKLVLPQSDIVVFPLPMLDVDGNINTPLCEHKVTLEECFDYILPGTVVLAGMVPDSAYAAACLREIEIIDYYKREEFTVLNAVPSALAKRWWR